MTTKDIDQIYEDWCGESHLVNSNIPTHDSAETQDFALYYQKVKKSFDTKEELKRYIELTIPFIMKPTRKAKTTFIGIFKSQKAQEIVVNELTESIWRRLNYD